MLDHIKSETPDERLVFGRRETCVIERIALVFTHTLPVLRPRVEHQYRAGGSMVGEDREHPPLVIMTKVKKAVPREDAVEAAAQRQLAHVGNDPFFIGQTLTAKRNHGR